MRHAPLATAVITACITSPVFAAENIETRAEERSEEIGRGNHRVLTADV